MFRFFTTRKWLFWSWLGSAAILSSLWVQVQIDVEINEWFQKKLQLHIDSGVYPNVGELAAIKQSIVDVLAEYKATHQLDDVVIGMSGGVDSALTAALFKEAGWTVHGVTLPIHQKQEETDRGQETIDALGLESHSFDLSENDTNIGFLEKSELPVDSADKIFKANLNEVLGPIKTKFGLSIYKIINISKEKEIKYEDAIKDVKKKLVKELSVEILFEKLEEGDFAVLTRIKANFYPHTKTVNEHKPHKDDSFARRWRGAVYCLNTCDGYTGFSDGTKVDSVANRILIFDASTLHNSTTTTTSAGRFNINFNFL